VVSPMD